MVEAFFFFNFFANLAIVIFVCAREPRANIVTRPKIHCLTQQD